MELYNKIKVIGKGSYGEVWSVKHKKDKKMYVLKKIDLRTASKKERTAAEQEAKLLAKLKHPNIVSYKDSFESNDGFLNIVMGFCECGDLYNKLKEQKGTSLPERTVVEWFVQISMALQYMHERNILHRDLKTQNIFLTKSKIIKVGDLGIARVLENSSSMATTLIGTPYYMSPELFSNKPYNHKSDVWALGCCVYEMATLKHAFNAKDINSLVYKILRGKIPNMPKEYDESLVTLIRAMLHSNPEKRPSVNRILRDPYIKKHITLFLEGTRKKVVTNQNNRVSSDNSSHSPSSGIVKNKNIKSRPASISESKNNKILEPLIVGPDLDPIREEPTPFQTDTSGSSHSSGSTNSHSLDNSSKEDLTKIASSKNNKSVESPKRQMSAFQPPHSNEYLQYPNSGVNREPSPNQRSDLENPGDNDKVSFLPPSGLGISPSRNSPVVIKHKNAQCVNGVSPPQHISYLKSNEKPRPLPPSPNSADKFFSEFKNNSDGYDEGLKLSARERRREKKGMQTPRTARSVEMKPRRNSESNVQVLAAGRFSADHAHSYAVQKQKSEISNILKVKQDAFTSSHEEINVLKKRELTRINLKEQGHQSSSSDDEPDKESKREIKKTERLFSKSKEMNNFISVLDQTLNMKKNKESDEDDVEVFEIEDTPISIIDVQNKEPLFSPGITYCVKKPKVLNRKQSPLILEEHTEENRSSPDETPEQVVYVGSAREELGTTRLIDRINALTKDCIHGLGEQRLNDAKKILDDDDGDKLESALVKILGKNNFDQYAGKIWQLKFCEEAAFGVAY